MLFTDMSVNSSSFLNLHLLSVECFNSSTVNLTFAGFSITNILLLLPLSILILYLGVQRWRSQRSISSGTTSHSDFFTYHMVAIEIISVLGSGCYCFGLYTDSRRMVMLGFYACSIILPGHSHFHILTCVERYLAEMKAGVRIRNIIIGCVWQLCFGWVGLIILFCPNFPIIPFLCLFAFTLIVVSFCSLSVLCLLIRPGPGDVGGDRVHADQSKQRAFHTVMAIMGVLLFKFGGLLVCTGISLGMRSSSDGCVLLMSAFWLCLPSSLVLPLLFLHRTGKLAGFIKCFRKSLVLL